jgi:radical S-adenosyl methionine domain-containing protein 2
MDSGAKETNREIGRCDIHGKTLTANGLANVVDQIRAINPLLEIKINTVVNALNWHENMCSEILRIAPTKWKVLRMLPIRTNDLAIDDSMFRSFVKRHAFLSNIMRVEDNQDMIESYIMIDPYGCFFQNSSVGDKYNISEPILDVGIEKAFKQIHWSEKKFFSRYAIPLLGENHEI